MTDTKKEDRYEEVNRKNFFVSYSRSDQEITIEIVSWLEQQDYRCWIDFRNIDMTQDWWDEIERGILSSDAFLYVLSDAYFKSPICQLELARALSHNKRIIGIVHAWPDIETAWHDIIETRLTYPNKDLYENYGYTFSGTVKNNWSIASRLNMPTIESSHEIATQLSATLEAFKTDFSYLRNHTKWLERALEWQYSEYQKGLLLFGPELQSAEIWLNISNNGQMPEATDIQKKYIKASRTIEQRRKKINAIIVISIIILIAISIIFSLISSNAQQNAQFARATSDSEGTYIALFDHFAISLGTSIGAVITPDVSQSFFVATQQARQTLIALDPIIRDFDGVPMVFVPSGCYYMGNQRHDLLEQPVHEQCIPYDFWIDQFEVTNALFETYQASPRQPRFSDPNQPRTSVTWYEALELCEARGMNLPNEIEWEYAARGPYSWLYPWGNDLIDDHVVFRSDEPLVIGARERSQSWVGAQDMIGNVSEWVNSSLMSYPISGDYIVNNLENRVIRGASYQISDISLLRSSYRSASSANLWNPTTGFRCVKIVDESR